MTNSSILNWAHHVFDNYRIWYRESKSRQILLRLDNLLVQSVSDSIIAGLWHTGQHEEWMSSSLGHRLRLIGGKAIGRPATVISTWIMNSSLFSIFSCLVVYGKSNPFRLISLFGIAFESVHIVGEGIWNNPGLLHLSADLLVLLLFIIVGKIKVNLKEVWTSSWFAILTAWLIDYDDKESSC